MIDTILDDGGPAFPIPSQTIDDGVTQITTQGAPGMSLRDVYAGQAVVGLIGQLQDSGCRIAIETYASGHEIPFEVAIARHAWIVAEAMMAERERRYGKQPEPEAEGVILDR
jgi:hypothetical protein